MLPIRSCTGRWRLVLSCVLLLLAAVGGGAGEGPSAADVKMPREPDKPVSAEAKPVPTVTITEKEYQELRDKAARADNVDPEPPSTCKISGQVSGNVAHLTLQFDFHSGERRTRIALGKLAYPTDAKLDDHPAPLQWDRNANSPLFVELGREKAGDHHLSLKIDVPLTTGKRATERGLVLDLPAAVTTTLDLELPPGLKKAEMTTEVRNEKPTAKPTLFPINAAAKEPYHLKPDGGLGPVETLTLSWEGEAPPSNDTLLNVTSCQINVNVDDRDVRTDAKITVGVWRGQLKEVRLAVPPQAIFPDSAVDERIERIEPATGPVRTVRLKQPTTEPLTLTIEVQQPHGRDWVPIGPFLVLGAFPQGGDIVINGGASRDVTLDLGKGESLYLLTQPSSITGETVARRYSLRSHVEKAGSLPALFQLKAVPRTSSFEAAVRHDLKLEGGAWRIATKITAQPLQGEPGEMLIRLPAGYTWDAATGVQSSPDIEKVEAPEASVSLLKVALKKRKGPPTKESPPYEVSFKGQFNANKEPLGDAGEMLVALPMLVSEKLSRPATVTVTLPDNLELTAPKLAGPFWENSKADAYNKRTWKPSSWPEAVGLVWQPYHPELNVNSELRLTLGGAQATAALHLWLPPGQVAPKSLLLSVPEGVIELKLAGDPKRSLEIKEGKCEVPLAAPIDRSHPLILSYAFALPAPEHRSDPFHVPIVRATNATRGSTRVSVWSDPGLQPELKEGQWVIQRTEEVKDELGYPALVLASERLDEPLVLGTGEAEGLPGFWVEHVLIQAKVDSSGQQKYRVRFLLTQLRTRTIDVELPTPLFRPIPSPDLSVLFAGKTAVWKPVDEAGKDTAVSRIARVQLPAGRAAKSGILEVNYQLSPSRSLLQTQLQRPQLRGDPSATEVRWQIVLPPSWVALSSEFAAPDYYDWGFRGWLLALRPTKTTADFDRWFVGDNNYRPEDTKSFGDTSVIVLRSSAEPVRLTCVPQQSWLLVCSLTLLIVGLLLAFLALPRGLFVGTLALIGVTALMAGLLWPGVLGTILYGCQPGAFVLLPVLALVWLLHQRYRRQVLFLPGFARRKAGSSLTRGSGRPRGEPSTVDAPPPAPAGSNSK